jgi:hypothetical protein
MPLCICILQKLSNCFASFQVGKGRDVGLNQIALFEGKVAGGNGEQVLSRDVYRLGQLFDFFRMLTFFYTTVGFYVCTMVFLPLHPASSSSLCRCLVVPESYVMGLYIMNKVTDSLCIDVFRQIILL